MASVLALLRLLLAAVLTIAATAKLADRPGSRRAFVDLGGPLALAPVAEWLLPACEVAIALLLIVPGTASAGALAALGLLSIFTLALAIVVARQGAVDCHCFGQLSASPVSWRTVARTGLLAAVAGVVVVADRAGGAVSPLSLGAIVSPDVLSPVLLLAVVCACTWMVSLSREARAREQVLTERIEALEQRLAASPTAAAEVAKAAPPVEGLPVGAPAPSTSGPTAPGRPTLRLFVSATCPPCKALSPDLPAWREVLGEAAHLEIVSRDEGDGKALAEAHRARWTPAAVLTGANGRVASPLRYGTDGVRDLFAALRESIVDGRVDEGALHRRLGSRLGATPLVVGDRAPALDLVDDDGRRHEPEAGRGQATLLLFWDPGCPYCQGMVEDLKALDAARPAGTPDLVFVVPREADAARAAQAAFASPTVFDPQSRVAPLIGGSGTPSAVLIDGDGRVASTVAIGKDAVLSLLAPYPAQVG